MGGEYYEKVIYSNGAVSSYVELETFNIIGQDSVAGFVLSNSGVISNCYASNISITNYSIMKESITAGFVGFNNASSSINGSYAKGVYASETEISASGEGIQTSGISAGFVYQNSGLIMDSYSNLKLYYKVNSLNKTGSLSAGFVYSNLASGTIKTSISYSAIVSNVQGQSYFSGINDESENNNSGTILNCYYYSPINEEDTYETGA